MIRRNSRYLLIRSGGIIRHCFPLTRVSRKFHAEKHIGKQNQQATPFCRENRNFYRGAAAASPHQDFALGTMGRSDYIAASTEKALSTTSQDDA